MKFLDLFAGIGGFRLGLEQAGHTCVGFVEIDKFARKSYEAIFDTKGEYTEHDINKISTKELPEADIWCFGFPCFTGDTLVQTKAGLKEIKDVLVNDEVVTIDGSWQKVLTTMNKMSTNVYNLKVQGQVDTKVTGNHPYWVRKKIRTHSGYKYSTPEWLEVEKIKHGDLVQSLRYKEAIEIPELSLNTLWLLGRYVADGYLFSQKRKDRPNPTYRTIFSIRTSKAKEFKKKLEHFNMTEDKSAGKYVHKFISTDKELYRLSSEFGKLAHNKEIPAYVFNMSKKQQETFLLGYLSGDGDITKNGYTRANSVSKKLIIGLSKLVESVYGCSVSIFYTKRPNKYIIEGREVNQRDTWTLQYSTKAKVKSYNQEQEAQWYPVKEIIPIEGTYTVYNLEVQNNHTYNANGVIVHNCQDISVAGKQKGFEGNRSSLFFAVTRKLHELEDKKKPSYLLIENVKNLLSINSGWDFASLQIELDSLGYDIEWDVLNSKEVVPQNRERVYIIGHLKNINTKKVFPINLEEDYERKITGMYKLSPNERTELSQFSLSKKKRENSICSQVQGLPKSIQLKLQKIASSKNSKGTEKIRFFSKGGLQKAQKQCKTSFCIDKRKGICQLVHLPTKEMLLLWSSRKYASQGQRYLQQQGKQIDNRSVRLTNGVSKREHCFKLLTVQFYKERLFISAGDGIYWTPLCIEKVEPTRRILSDILEKIVPEKYFLSSEKTEKLIKQCKGGGQEPKIAVREATKIGYDVAQLGDSINFAQPNSKTRRGRVGHGVANTLTTGIEQATLTGNLRIRKLTPLETWRLQGFPDWAFNLARKAGLSDSQLYKQAGNSVTVPVIYEIAKKLKFEEV